MENEMIPEAQKILLQIPKVFFYMSLMGIVVGFFMYGSSSEEDEVHESLTLLKMCGILLLFSIVLNVILKLYINCWS